MIARWIVVCMLALCADGAFAQELPSQIRIVVPLVAGSSLDTRCRVIADALGKQLGRRVIVENRPGAGGTIGARHVARAKADGATLLMNNNSHVIGPHVHPDSGYDPIGDFIPVVEAYSSGLVIVAHPQLKAASIKAFAELARRQPLSYGSSGTGSLPHLAMEILLSSAGIEVTHVPYRGDAQAMTDLLGGRIDLMVAGYPTAIPQVRAGNLRAIGVTSASRTPVFPGVATVAESYPDYVMDAWAAFFAPAGTPPAIVDRLRKALTAALVTPGVRAHYAATGAELSPRPHDQFAGFVRQEWERYGRLVRALGLQAQ